MEVRILKETGYSEALLGLSLSYGITVEKAIEVSQRLYDMELGHNKFLESMCVWLAVTAPRFWWSEADTYRITTKQSESTMHTLHKRNLVQEDFEYPIYPETLSRVNYLIERFRSTKKPEDLQTLKNELPEGFLQQRIWVVNYKNLRNIVAQRRTHRLQQWQHFCKVILEGVEHPEYFNDIRAKEE